MLQDVAAEGKKMGETLSNATNEKNTNQSCSAWHFGQTVVLVL